MVLFLSLAAPPDEGSTGGSTADVPRNISPAVTSVNHPAA
jgi:hypothetical protein